MILAHTLLENPLRAVIRHVILHYLHTFIFLHSELDIIESIYYSALALHFIYKKQSQILMVHEIIDRAGFLEMEN